MLRARRRSLSDILTTVKAYYATMYGRKLTRSETEFVQYSNRIERERVNTTCHYHITTIERHDRAIVAALLLEKGK